MADRSSVIYHARVNGKEVIARLKAHGWLVDRVHGSHHILAKEGKAVLCPCTAHVSSVLVFSQPYSARPA